MEFLRYYIEGVGVDENVLRYAEMEPFEIDEIVYMPPRFIGRGMAMDEFGDWAQSLPMVDMKLDHSETCSACYHAARSNSLIIVGKEGE